MAQQLKQYSTYLWQEVNRIPIYRIQTNDKDIARKLSKRPKAKLCVVGLNAPFWVFQLRYSSPKKAILGLGNITHEDVHELPELSIFVSYTLPHMGTNSRGEV